MLPNINTKEKTFGQIIEEQTDILFEGQVAISDGIHKLNKNMDRLITLTKAIMDMQVKQHEELKEKLFEQKETADEARRKKQSKVQQENNTSRSGGGTNNFGLLGSLASISAELIPSIIGSAFKGLFKTIGLSGEALKGLFTFLTGPSIKAIFSSIGKFAGMILPMIPTLLRFIPILGTIFAAGGLIYKIFDWLASKEDKAIIQSKQNIESGKTADITDRSSVNAALTEFQTAASAKNQKGVFYDPTFSKNAGTRLSTAGKKFNFQSANYAPLTKGILGAIDVYGIDNSDIIEAVRKIYQSIPSDKKKKFIDSLQRMAEELKVNLTDEFINQIQSRSISENDAGYNQLFMESNEFPSETVDVEKNTSVKQEYQPSATEQMYHDMARERGMDEAFPLEDRGYVSPAVSPVQKNTAIPSVFDFERYKEAIAKRESDGDYTAVNKIGFIGRYQMGTMALKDAGFIKSSVGNSNKVLDDSNSWTGKMGVTSKQDFLNNPSAQDNAFKMYTFKNLQALKNKGKITNESSASDIAAALAPSHLLGVSGYLKNNAGTDAYGTSGLEYEKIGRTSQQLMKGSIASNGGTTIAPVVINGGDTTVNGQQAMSQGTPNLTVGPSSKKEAFSNYIAFQT